MIYKMASTIYILKRSIYNYIEVITVIISNLSSIMGQKKLKIADIMKKTGITRPTLTKLYYNDCSGITFDTLNSLCEYLNIMPNDLLLFINADIKDVSITFSEPITLESFPVDEEGNGFDAITNASFVGHISFEQNNLSPVMIEGSLSCYSDDHVYSGELVYSDTPFNNFNLFLDANLDYICEIILDAFYQIDEIANIADISIRKKV